MANPTDAVQSVNLHAMPLNFDQWAKIVAGCTAGQEGALMRAVRVAWQAGHRGAPAGTLPNNDGELSRMLGGREHLETIRRHFRPLEGDASLLAWGWLSAAYAEALDRYQRRKLAGVESGETRRRKAKERQPSAGRTREQCSNNVRVLLEQPKPKPNPEGEGPTDLSPIGGAMTARALGGSASSPDELDEAAVAAWRAAHPAAAEALERAADDAMTQINPEWRELPPRFGSGVRARWLTTQLARAIAGAVPLTPAGGPDA